MCKMVKKSPFENLRHVCYIYLSVVKCGSKNVKDPTAIMSIPAEIYRGLDAVGLPPKYVMGTIAISDPRSYDPATKPL